MQTVEKKKIYFDNYWKQQPESRVDPRSLQRAKAVDRLLQKRSGCLLDVGCGRGLILDYFAGRGYDVTGVDISPEAVEMVRQNGHKVQVLDLEQEEISEKYDVILCLEVLQQLHDPVAVLGKLVSALHENGELVVSMPNEFHIISRLKLLFGRSHLGDFSHSHIRLFFPSRDKKLFENANLKIINKLYVPIAPPKWKTISMIFRPLAQMCPSLLAISSIYTLEKS